MKNLPFKGTIYQPKEDRPYHNTPYTKYTWELSVDGKYVIIYLELENAKLIMTESEFFGLMKTGQWKYWGRRKRFFKHRGETNG